MWDCPFPCIMRQKEQKISLSFSNIPLSSLFKFNSSLKCAVWELLLIPLQEERFAMTLISLVPAPWTGFRAGQCLLGWVAMPCESMELGTGCPISDRPTKAGLPGASSGKLLVDVLPEEVMLREVFSTPATQAGPQRCLALGCRGWWWDEDFGRSRCEWGGNITFFQREIILPPAPAFISLLIVWGVYLHHFHLTFAFLSSLFLLNTIPGLSVRK